MKYKQCTCTYWELVKRGIKPMDHNPTCKCSMRYVAPPEKRKRFWFPDIENPYPEVDRFISERRKPTT